MKKILIAFFIILVLALFSLYFIKGLYPLYANPETTLVSVENLSENSIHIKLDNANSIGFYSDYDIAIIGNKAYIYITTTNDSKKAIDCSFDCDVLGIDEVYLSDVKGNVKLLWEREATPKLSDYAFVISGKVFELIDSKYEDGIINEIEYPVVSENIEILDETSDTFNGSTLKTIEYTDLKITLIAPPQSTNFSIINMVSTIVDIGTPRGLKVGNSLEELISLYTEIEKVEWEDNLYIMQDDSKVYEMKVTVEDDSVTQIEMDYILQ